LSGLGERDLAANVDEILCTGLWYGLSSSKVTKTLRHRFDFEIKYKSGKDSLSQKTETYPDVTNASCTSIDLEYGFSSYMPMSSNIIK